MQSRLIRVVLALWTRTRQVHSTGQTWGMLPLAYTICGSQPRAPSQPHGQRLHMIVGNPSLPTNPILFIPPLRPSLSSYIWETTEAYQASGYLLGPG